MLSDLLQSFGYAAVFVVVMVESLGIPVPGETMLATAALYAGTTGRLSLGYVIGAASVAAILGDNIGYLIGRRGGYALLRRFGDKVGLGQRRMKIGRLLFLRRGGSIVFWGRFVSVLRTYAAFLAGTNQMPWRRFLVFNALGGIAWSTVYGVGYFYAGHAVESASRPVGVAIGAVAVVVVVGGFWYARRHEVRLGAQAEAVLPGDVEDYAPGKLDGHQQEQLRRRAVEIATR